MRKTFPLTDPRHEPPRVIAAIKNDVRKYLKRERGKKLPEGADFWDFDCKVGKAEPGTATHVGDLTKAIDAVAEQGGTQVYIEILAKAAKRKAKAKDE